MYIQVQEKIQEPMLAGQTCFTKPALPNNRENSNGHKSIQLNNSPPTSSSTMVVDSYGLAEGRGAPCTPGLCGIMNLGNTCFLNSIIQCLSNCKPITTYFLERRHLEEINENNPLGRAGQIANSFADVITLMWSGTHSVVVPHYFKLQLTKFAPQFAGYQQHDAQELLTFLLDGLHEDLNRIKVKPYLETEFTGTDEELAKASWDYFKSRNDSIIIDHFHGMLKSRVVCPDCEKISIKFDSFSNLPLPLPLHCDKTMVVRYVPYDQTKPISDLIVKIPKKGVVEDLILELSRVTGVSEGHIIIAKVNKGHFHRFFSRDDLLEQVEDIRDKLIMYDLPTEIMENRSNYSILPVVLWEVQDVCLNNLFGTPFLMAVPKQKMYFKTLYDLLCERLSRSFPGFLKANTSFGCITMDCESVPGEDGSTKFKNQYLFSPVFVNNFCFEQKILQFDEQDLFEIPESFGRDFLALKITRNVRMEYYKEPQPARVDHTEVFKGTPKINIDDCLSLFTTTEKLNESNAWFCPKCRVMKKATKKLDLWKLPNILIFQMKRFTFNQIRREKLDLKIDFPLTGLNINQYVADKHKENLVYDLIGVCNHYGSLMGGHYTATCKNFMDGKWYYFDDTSVTPVSAESVQTENAYVLFYQRRPTPETPANTDDENIDK